MSPRYLATDTRIFGEIDSAFVAQKNILWQKKADKSSALYNSMFKIYFLTAVARSSGFAAIATPGSLTGAPI